MNDITNTPNPNMNMDPNRRLKKVKRPVKRMVPQGSNMPVSPSAQNTGLPQQQNTPQGGQRAQEIDAFNLDAYIDENANLPALSDDNYFADQNQQYAPGSTPHFIDESELMAEQMPAGNYQTGTVAKKIAIIIGIAAFLAGFIAAKLMFGQQKVVRDGLQGIVVNSEVPRGRARCGVAEKTQGCVLYIMNPQRQELNASDFYDLASQLTGRQRFVIETGNMRYSNRKIKPGEIAQFNIPPLQ